MKLFLAFSGEGPTDHRFIPILIERIIQEFFFEKAITAEFSWITFSKNGSSHDNILKVCSDAFDQHCILFHRDSGNISWNEAYENHFASAVAKIDEDLENHYNKNLIPVIPVRETEAWMLVNKALLKAKIETDLSDNDLLLTYKVSRIEEIGDPKSVVEKAILKYHESLTPKQRRYAVKIGELYDLVASEVPISDLDKLDAFSKMKKTLVATLESIT